jgi:hypothetical protein
MVHETTEKPFHPPRRGYHPSLVEIGQDDDTESGGRDARRSLVVRNKLIACDDVLERRDVWGLSRSTAGGGGRLACAHTDTVRHAEWNVLRVRFSPMLWCRRSKESLLQDSVETW